MDNFNKKKINPNDFIERYNNQYNKSLVLKKEIKNKKDVSVKLLIASFIPVLYKDWKKTIKGGADATPNATNTISNAIQNENQNNFFNYLSRTPEFTNVYNKVDLTTNQVANDYPPISTYSRDSF
jgi:hypothetical protein